MVFGILLQVIDGWTTHEILNSPGGYEKNPLMARLFKAIGELPGIVIAKGVGAFLIYVLCIHQSFVVIPVVVLYIAAAINNVSVLRKIKSSQS